MNALKVSLLSWHSSAEGWARCTPRPYPALFDHFWSKGLSRPRGPRPTSEIKNYWKNHCWVAPGTPPTVFPYRSRWDGILTLMLSLMTLSLLGAILRFRSLRSTMTSSSNQADIAVGSTCQTWEEAPPTRQSSPPLSALDSSTFWRIPLLESSLPHLLGRGYKEEDVIKMFLDATKCFNTPSDHCIFKSIPSEYIIRFHAKYHSRDIYRKQIQTLFIKYTKQILTNNLWIKGLCVSYHIPKNI